MHFSVFLLLRCSITRLDQLFSHSVVQSLEETPGVFEGLCKDKGHILRNSVGHFFCATFWLFMHVDKSGLYKPFARKPWLTVYRAFPGVRRGATAIHG